MTWINDLGSGFGVPAGASTIAAAMYAACAAAEKAARPGALRDIGHFLKDRNWSASARPSAIVSRVFNATFGERHLSLKCAGRSVLATFVFVTAVVVTVYLETGKMRSFNRAFWFYLVFAGVPSDYLALLKTRILLKIVLAPILLLIIDVCASLIISSIVYLIVIVPVRTTGLADFLQTERYPDIISVFKDLIYLWNVLFHVERLEFFTPPIMFITTLLTSIWIVLIIFSSITLKMLSPTQRFVAWFFDVDHHPIKAIGIVSGALAIICSLLWVAGAALFPHSTTLSGVGRPAASARLGPHDRPSP
jgi:hypothetical protein